MATADRFGSGPKVRELSSRDNPLLVGVRKLTADPGGYRKHGEVWLEGDHLCSAYVQRGGAAPLRALVTPAAWANPELRRLASIAQEVNLLPAALMDGLSQLESAPPIAFIVPWVPASVPLPGLPSVVLDRLQDAGNVGAVLRTAAAFGFQQVVALKGTAALWSPKVLRAGMGAHFGLRLVEANDASLLAEQLAVPLLATSSHAPQSLPELSLPWPCAWVLGHEGKGVSDALMAACTHAVRIPQPGGEESLNVATAAAVCLYESARQRLVSAAAVK